MALWLWADVLDLLEDGTNSWPTSLSWNKWSWRASSLYQNETLAILANLFHLMLNFVLGPQLLSRHFTTPGHISQNKDGAGLTPRGRNARCGTPNISSEIFVLKPLPEVATTGSTPVGTMPRAASTASLCELASPQLSLWLSAGRGPTCHLIQPPGDVSSFPLLCSSLWSCEESTVGDSFIPGEATLF